MENTSSQERKEKILASLNNSKLHHCNARLISLIHSLKNPELFPFDYHHTSNGRFKYPFAPPIMEDPISDTFKILIIIIYHHNFRAYL